MMWFIFAVISAILITIFDLIQKRILTDIHALEYSSLRTLLTFFLTIFFIPFINFNIPYYTIAIVYVLSIIITVEILFRNKCIRHMEISTIIPLTNLSPLFLIFLGYFILNERLMPSHIAGILLLLFGAYMLESSHKSILSPVKMFFRSKYFLYILLVLFVSSIGQILTKVTLNLMAPLTLLFFVWFFTSLNFTIIHLINYDFYGGMRHGFRKDGMWIFLASLLILLSDLAYLKAMSLAFVSLVVPVTRLSTLFTTIIGGRLFHEKHLFIKGAACIVLLMGTILVVIG